MFQFHTAANDVSALGAVGENVKEFFFRVASLAFETSVLSELEKSGSRQIGDVVREYLSEQSLIKCQTGCTVRHPGYLFFFFFTGINSNSNNVYTSSKKKQSNCCQ